MIGVLMLCLMIWAAGELLGEVIPHTQRIFWSYQSFLNQADFSVYEQELPESARDLRYYYYEGFFADKSGYHAAFSQEDYEIMKENRLAKYTPWIEYGDYCYDGGPKLYLDYDQMEQQRIDFLNKIMVQGEGGYYFLAYSLFENEQEYSFNGVLCNDETCEIVEFTCRVCSSW